MRHFVSEFRISAFFPFAKVKIRRPAPQNQTPRNKWACLILQIYQTRSF